MQSAHPPRAHDVAEVAELLEEIVAQFGGQGYPLSERERLVLEALGEGHARTQSDLGHGTGIEKAALSRLLDELEERRLVARTRDVRDGRRVVIELTPEGVRARRVRVRFDRETVFAALCRWPLADRWAVFRSVRVLARRRLPNGRNVPPELQQSSGRTGI